MESTSWESGDAECVDVWLSELSPVTTVGSEPSEKIPGPADHRDSYS